MTKNELQAAIAEEKRKYFRDYYAKNREKILAKNERYWERKAAQSLAAQEEQADGK